MSQRGAASKTWLLTAQSSHRDVPCGGDPRAGQARFPQREPGGAKVLGNGISLPGARQGQGKARPPVRRQPVRVFQGLKLIWAGASAERLPRSPGLRRPWGQCQRWDRVLLPGPPLQMHLA